MFTPTNVTLTYDLHWKWVILAASWGIRLALTRLFWWFLSLLLRTAEDANTSYTGRKDLLAQVRKALKTNVIRYLEQRYRSGWIGNDDMVAVSLRFDPPNAWIWQSLSWNKSAQRVSLIQRRHAGREESGTRWISREMTNHETADSCASHKHGWLLRSSSTTLFICCSDSPLKQYDVYTILILSAISQHKTPCF